MESFKLRTKNAVKKLAILGGAMALAASFITPALAAGLADLPAPFVADGKMVSTIVVGGRASTIDVAGAIDLGAAFAQKATTTQMIGVGTTTTISEGKLIAANANDLNYGQAFTGILTKLTDRDLAILADGEVTDKLDVTFDYTQELYLGGDSVRYSVLDEDNYAKNTGLASKEIPVLNIDMSAGKAYDLIVDFKGDTVDFSNFEGDSIVLFGKEFTIDPNMKTADTTLVLFSASDTTYLQLGEAQTIEGNTLTITGGNTGDSTAILRINSEQKTVEKGKTYTIGGIKVYVKDVYVTDIPELSVSATVFVGSDEVKIIADASTNDVEVNGQDLAGVQATVTASGVDDVQDITFTITPSAFDEDTDEKSYLEAGESLVDPLFGTFKMYFAGAEPDLMASTKDYLEFKKSSSDLQVTFTNRDGDEVVFKPYTYIATDKVYSKVYSLDTTYANYGALDKGDIFILTEGVPAAKGSVSKVYEITRISTTDDEIEVKDYATGRTEKVRAGETIGDTGAIVCSDTNNLDFQTGDLVWLDGTDCTLGDVELVQRVVYTDADVSVAFGALAPAGAVRVAITAIEGTAGNVYETADVAEGTFTINIDGDDTEKVQIQTPIIAGAVMGGDTDNDGDYGYYLSEYGTYLHHEADKLSWLKMYTPIEEQDFLVFVAPVDATTSISGGDMESTKVNYITPGVGVLDGDVNTASLANPIILVGGPAVNTLVADLIAANKAAPVSEYSENSAKIQLIENAFGSNAALVVAGWDGKDTRLACRALANTIVGGPNALALTGNIVNLNTGVTGYSQVTLK